MKVEIKITLDDGTSQEIIFPHIDNKKGTQALVNSLIGLIGSDMKGWE